MRQIIVILVVTGLLLTACGSPQTPILSDTQPVAPTATSEAEENVGEEEELNTPIPTPTITPTYLPSPTLLPAELPDAALPPDPEDAEVLMLPAAVTLLGEDVPRVGAAAVALAPGYPADPTIVAITRRREVLLSTDDGESWMLFEDSFPLSEEARPEIERLYFLPTGELIAMGGFYVFRSWDNGATWVNMAIAGEPSDLIYANDAHFVVTSGHVWRSPDGGVRWEEVLPPIEGCPTAIAFSARGNHGFASRCGNLALSTDGGLTWEEIPNETPDVWPNNAITRLFIAPYYPDDPRIIGLGSGNELNLSTDGGRTWTSLSAAWEEPVLAFQTLTMSPGFTADSSLMGVGVESVYDIGVTLWRLDDGGETRLPIASFPGRNCVADVVYAPNAPSTVFVTGCHGIFRSDDSGATWRFVHPGAAPLEEGSFAIDRSQDDAYVVVQAIVIDDLIAHRRVMVDSGEGWSHRITIPGEGRPQRLWASPCFLEDGVLISLDAGLGGLLQVGSWQPGLAAWLNHGKVNAPTIPQGMSDSIDDYEIYFDINYRTNNTIRLRHPSHRVTYVSEDAGLSWERVDPINVNECYWRPRGGIEALWEENDTVRLLLGCPITDEIVGPDALTQPFESGLLLRVTEPLDTGDVIDWRFSLISLESLNYWGMLAQPADVEELPEPPEGLQAPAPEFARAWLTQEYSDGADGWQPIRDTVGWATGPAEPLDVIFQPFENGWMVWWAGEGWINVIYRVPGADLPLWEVYQSDYIEPW